MKERIEVSAPGKLMLFGEHAVVYGRPCIVTAVDQRLRVKVEVKSGNSLEINAPDVGVEGFKCVPKDSLTEDLPKGARFIAVAVNNFFNKYGVDAGMSVTTRSDFSSQFGFGSSSAATVGVVMALSEVFDLDLNKREIFDLSYKTVLDIQGVGSGFDIAAAIWGGTIYFVGGGKKITPLKLESLPLIVGYTRVKADTATLVKKVAEFHENHKTLVNGIFDLMTKITNEAREELSNNDFEAIGELMQINEGLLESLGVGSRELSKLISAAKGSGAYGAKLSGAGGGDCMIAVADNRKKKLVEKAIEFSGGQVLSVKTGAEGVRVEK